MLKIIGAFFVCLWCADFLTGFFHWLEDTYCLEDYPLIGSYICEPNIEHHVDPQLMVRTGTFFSRNLLQWGMSAGMFGILWLIGFGNIYTFATLLMTSFGNEIHRWNHMHKTNRFVTFVKDFGIIQAHKQHSMHHKPPHSFYYCVMTSQVNAVLERVNFWRKLEWLVEATTGIAPKRENRRDSKPAKKEKPAKKTVATKTTDENKATALAKSVEATTSSAKKALRVMPPRVTEAAKPVLVQCAKSDSGKKRNCKNCAGCANAKQSKVGGGHFTGSHLSTDGNLDEEKPNEQSVLVAEAAVN